MASIFSLPLRSSCMYFVSTCTESLIPTTNSMVGKTVSMRSKSFPIIFKNPSVQIMLNSTTVVGIMIPHPLRKAMNKKMVVRTKLIEMKSANSLIMSST